MNHNEAERFCQDQHVCMFCLFPNILHELNLVFVKMYVENHKIVKQVLSEKDVLMYVYNKLKIGQKHKRLKVRQDSHFSQVSKGSLHILGRCLFNSKVLLFMECGFFLM